MQWASSAIAPIWIEAHQKAVGLSDALLLKQAQALLLCKIFRLGCRVLPALLQMPIRVLVLTKILRSCNKIFLSLKKRALSEVMFAQRAAGNLDPTMLI